MKNEASKEKKIYSGFCVFLEIDNLFFLHIFSFIHYTLKAIFRGQ